MTRTKKAGHDAGSRSMARTRRLGFLLALPAIIYITIFLVVPLVYNIWLSISDANGSNLITGDYHPTGFANYKEMLASPGFWNGVKLSAIFTVASLALQFLVGYALALFFRKPFPGNGIIRALLLVAWILPAVVTGTIFRWMFDSDFGVINYFLTSMHLVDKPVMWLTGPTTAMVAVVVANLWVGMPFNMLLILSGLHTIDDGLYEAAEVDGAGPIRTFFSITEPLMRPVVFSLLLLGVINTYKVFDLIYTMTKGGPVEATTTLPIFTYLQTFKVFDFGNGAAASMLTMVLPLALSWFYVRSLDKEDA
ncbi:ABC transporter permease [Actinomyces sp. S6-Spd3]|uniref:carbohydrate ABC transporter permease n=2 Tax=Actinomycetaceae TaxID=2049 RepID=UPI00050DC0AD|nr:MULTISPECIES: sugar ABC transporter permease [Actinomyces]KGF01096.1 ABC transporter permease [Actinomyces sp. S6-Spd3]MBF0949230.1 sugar ABC transporter permease [Actinomyces sp.]MDU1430573.1 sugar ABC transporter permease [Actinomyces sp.]